MTDTITLTRPDDWHLHLRDGAMLDAVTPDTAADFGRALIMPNLVPPVVTGADAAAYRDRIMAAIPAGADFTPMMTLYLTEGTDPGDLVAAAKSGLITAVKLYPAGATTNSASGVRDIDKVMPVLEAMAEADVPLCVHGEVTDPEIDIFDREAVFIDRVLDPLRTRLPQLRVVMEHVTTSDGVEYVKGGGDSIAATLTTHHLFINRNHILAGGIRPHYYCLPVAKRESHRRALLTAATSGDASFFLGTDSAPHLDQAKLAPCGCAGIYTAPNTLACLAQIFEAEGALDRLNGFVAVHGAAFYGVPVNGGTVTLRRETDAQPVPEARATPEGALTVFDPMVPIHWTVVG
ncbi:MAG TPA: dihydroorotase [Alphaproteobacteria bacterium]|jgi:dihydroorotase|nr:MAG: dihydroorotase [Candidatus Puniceispirillum sp. TMED245]HCV88267.1 dihydroorotase [Alphaproteobacteria bacterium]